MDTAAEAEKERADNRSMFSGFNKSYVDFNWQPAPYASPASSSTAAVAALGQSPSAGSTPLIAAPTVPTHYGWCIMQQGQNTGAKFYVTGAIGFGGEGKGATELPVFAKDVSAKFSVSDGKPECIVVATTLTLAQEVVAVSIPMLKQMGTVVDTGWKP